jgi:hypothetical protein
VPGTPLGNLEDLLAQSVTAEQAVAVIGQQVVHVVEQARTALAAELAVSDVMGVVQLAAPPGAVDAREVEEFMFLGLVDWADRSATPGSLALLRACQVLGLPAVHEAAAASAARLAGSGVSDRPWARIIGRPRALRAWRYDDVFGEQESASVLFGYPGREHAVTALVDHQLGGGVKDCWVAEGRRATALRDRAAHQMAEEPTAFFEDLPVPEAAELLAEALRHPPCPEKEDQVQDVASYLPVLRARVALLVAASPA